MRNVTICFTYFRSLTLANLAAALYALRQQDFSRVNSIVFVDNNTDDSCGQIWQIVEAERFPVPIDFYSEKHGDETRTHAWSTNTAVRRAETSWVFFTRADYLLDFDTLSKFVAVTERYPEEWDGFVTSNGCHLAVDITTCEQSMWRQSGPSILGRAGVVYDYTAIDTGVWLARCDAFNRVGGLDERLTAWGHAQTHFQHKLYQTGTEFVRILEVLFFHPTHAAEKNLDLAHEQIRAIGADLREMWARYEGMQMY